MNKEQIIRLAREAGLAKYGNGLREGIYPFMESIDRFAELVRADEREACAKVCETRGVHPGLNVFAGGPDWYKHGKDCAAAIRARGEASIRSNT